MPNFQFALSNSFQPEGVVNVKHPFQPEDSISVDALMALVDHEYELLRDEDACDPFGLDVSGRLNNLLNRIISSLSSDQDKNAFIAAATERYIGEQ